MTQSMIQLGFRTFATSICLLILGIALPFAISTSHAEDDVHIVAFKMKIETRIEGNPTEQDKKSDVMRVAEQRVLSNLLPLLDVENRGSRGQWASGREWLLPLLRVLPNPQIAFRPSRRSRLTTFLTVDSATSIEDVTADVEFKMAIPGRWSAWRLAAHENVGGVSKGKIESLKLVLEVTGESDPRYQVRFGKMLEKPVELARFDGILAIYGILGAPDLSIRRRTQVLGDILRNPVDKRYSREIKGAWEGAFTDLRSEIEKIVQSGPNSIAKASLSVVLRSELFDEVRIPLLTGVEIPPAFGVQLREWPQGMSRAELWQYETQPRLSFVADQNQFIAQRRRLSQFAGALVHCALLTR